MKTQLILVGLLIATTLQAQGERPLVRRVLEAPEVLSGVSCDASGRFAAEFFEDGSLHSCPLANDTTISGHAFPRGTWVILRRSGSLRGVWLPSHTLLAGHLCHGKGYKHYAVSFREGDGSLSMCYLARDTVIDGVPCVRGTFWTEIRGGTKSAASFHPDGSLAGCQLSRNAIVGGRKYRKWDRIRVPSNTPSG